METVKISKEVKARVWIEGDMFGGTHVMVQHEREPKPFEYCTFNYNYLYTDNSTIRKAAERMAVSLGAEEPVEYKVREFGGA